MVIIRPIEFEDIEKRGFLEVLENLVPVGLDRIRAKQILQEIKSNPLHKIFVAQEEEGMEQQEEQPQTQAQEDIDEKKKTKVVGTTTLLVEPKFIHKGTRVGYIEDVSVRRGYDGLGIGSQLITYATQDAISVEGCGKILLYCSKNTMPFYEKLGYKLVDDTFLMKFER
ncbi:MAG TPA: GNAT family N-acetyltransferase [Nitrososphaeraceae archaeon]|nr:GNAT family N-acetyltransferase [Nitrososphaeraceae archaeon]